ncbi:hypothetical protein N9A28_03545 [Sulfurimonas sp.]|nr:hypothetical protein [Sulfurimonas sp.]
MQIPVADLIESLKEGYQDYKKSLSDDTGEEDLGHVKGFCTTIEQILAAYGNVTSTEMMKIKNPIIGDVSLSRKNVVDYDTPTFIRQQKD